jgi:hypothetical protein
LFGAGNPAASFSSFIFRAITGGSFNPSNRAACVANSTLSVFSTSPASAAIASVSNVMKFSCTHEARDCFTPKSNSRLSASSRNALACSTVGAAALTSLALRTLLCGCASFGFCSGGAVSLGSCASPEATA